ncbi:MAG: hypothetical protein Q8S19_07830 [Bacillota bacterium]|nr:hypothetical protein [Bacillota bacterium]
MQLGHGFQMDKIRPVLPVGDYGQDAAGRKAVSPPMMLTELFL